MTYLLRIYCNISFVKCSN